MDDNMDDNIYIYIFISLNGGLHIFDNCTMEIGTR